LKKIQDVRKQTNKRMNHSVMNPATPPLAFPSQVLDKPLRKRQRKCAQVQTLSVFTLE